MKKILAFALSAIVGITTLSGCSNGDAEAKEKEKVVRIGVTGTDGEAWSILQKKAEKEGMKIKLVEFSDYTTPNKALADGDIELNAFQHIAFLEQFKKEHKLDITAVGTTQIAPMGLFSEKYKKPNDIPNGSEIAIPNDPTNQARALKLLDAAGLLKLKKDFGLFGDPSGIAENPKKLKITPVIAQQTPRVLKDVAASVINNGVAGQAGLNPAKDPIFLEDPKNDSAKAYINIFAARTKDKDDPTIKKVIKLYHSKEVTDAIKKETKDGSISVDLSLDEIEKIVK
ncbi:MetQ/NlpA family ABC transporter substrate-binding protein [Bacillus cytotoxicus]|uniref:MetQ/NlpA family ABC transporter substrate-binding protein n=1 Tax=Bacillus cytotoxicus TaxID=580165 RepID=UPI0008642C6D|nr:MetQ/NlpA family ABC transporter substrate-binding protein [Bacillus cytotoxicus]AWC27290.1 methionine ABC transporter substrate-binding protein [Bacillus cytotoxicus]AWC39403.1 methionine ABC transporter substrate-binding protein [Bacillus cytotoxicus]AWC47334.1 methionine ABC transporter substrate-binding protein [Bacillus cytotoxicus]AWC51356.1 methionine ABC transporter substrate-binding protein [Bacillus cytotoxicus]AWC55485.1 methionine ABC transporter substrate-binding protein [Bacil